MAVTLTNSPHQIGSSAQMNGEGSYYYYFYAQYTPLANKKARLTFTFRVASTGEEGCSISRTKFYVTVDGTSYNIDNLSVSVPRRASQYVANWTGYLGNLSVDVDYDADGTWANKTVSFKMSGGSGTYSGGGSMGDAGCGTRSGTITLPPLPTGSVATSLLSDGYQGHTVAGHSKIRTTINYTNAKKVVVKYSGNGITSTKTLLNVSSNQSSSITDDYTVPIGESAYNLSVEVTLTNVDEQSSTVSTTHAVDGYSKPTYNPNTTVAFRTDSAGTESKPQGTYGKVHLTWDSTSITPVDTSVPNTLQYLKVILERDGVNTTLYDGTAPAAGYADYLFTLPENVQGNLIVTFTDNIDTQIVESIVIPKSLMPLSLYQNGNAVGCAVGRMATEEGLWCYVDLYLLGDNGYTLYHIHVDSNGVLCADPVS